MSKRSNIVVLNIKNEKILFESIFRISLMLSQKNFVIMGRTPIWIR